MIFITKRNRLTVYLSLSILLLNQKNTTIFNNFSSFPREVKENVESCRKYGVLRWNFKRKRCTLVDLTFHFYFDVIFIS
jgi:hypothetical protein